MKSNKTHQAERSREAVAAARARGDKRGLALALAELGYALFQIKAYEQGIAAFTQAAEQTAALDDRKLHKQCLGRQVAAYQFAGRLPDAYRFATEIFELGQEQGDQTIQCDGRLSQGQILLESGEPLIALERIQEALALARASADRRREMNVLGALGHLSLDMAATDQAEAYFRKALALARALADAEAVHGYLGNVAMILAFHRRYDEAIDAFETVLAYFEGRNEQRAAVEALRHLVQVHEARGENERVVECARRGIALAAPTNVEGLFFFYENLILALYRLERPAEAEQATEEAVAAARTGRDRQRELSFLLSLGESYLLAGAPGKALGAYEEARAGAVRLSRQQDEAYLTGRIGVALAEAGCLEEAISQHERAVELAQARELPELEGEQLSMLALAYLDRSRQNDALADAQRRAPYLSRARSYAERSLAVFNRAGLQEQADSARRLLSQLEAPAQG